MKEQELTIEDQFAISLPAEGIPEINGVEGAKEMAKVMAYDLPEVPTTNDLIEFSLHYHAYIRRRYASAMMSYRW